MKRSKGLRPVTIRECYQRYVTDHGRHVIDQSRLEFAWRNLQVIGKHFVGAQTYSHTANYCLRRKAAGSAESTVRRELGILKTAFKHAWKVGLLTYVPPVYQAKHGKPRKTIITKEDMTNILTTTVASSKHYPEWLVRFCILLMHTGQRKEAVLSLEWDQVDFKAGLIDFNKAIPMAERRKGRGIVPISEEFRAYLVEWHANKTCPYVVMGPDGDRVYFPYVAWHNLMKECGLPGVTPHIIRHSLATMMVRDNENIRHVQQFLGHKSVVTTEREYVKNDPETIRGTVERLAFLK